MNCFRLLNHPLIYATVVRIFSLGGRDRKLRGFFDKLLAQECQGAVLEVGSGTCQYRDVYLKYLHNYVASDINLKYLQYSQKSEKFLWYTTCDCASLPFISRSFDRVFALYLFHHLSDDVLLGTINEVQRCLKPNGKIIIVDTLCPEKRWDLLGWMLSRFDRGQYFRQRQSLINLIQRSGNFQIDAIDNIPGSWPYSMTAYILTPQPSAGS